MHPLSCGHYQSLGNSAQDPSNWVFADHLGGALGGATGGRGEAHPNLWRSNPSVGAGKDKKSSPRPNHALHLGRLVLVRTRSVRSSTRVIGMHAFPRGCMLRSLRSSTCWMLHLPALSSWSIPVPDSSASVGSPMRPRGAFACSKGAGDGVRSHQEWTTIRSLHNPTLLRARAVPFVASQSPNGRAERGSKRKTSTSHHDEKTRWCDRCD